MLRFYNQYTMRKIREYISLLILVYHFSFKWIPPFIHLQFISISAVNLSTPSASVPWKMIHNATLTWNYYVIHHVYRPEYYIKYCEVNKNIHSFASCFLLRWNFSVVLRYPWCSREVFISFWASVCIVCLWRHSHIVCFHLLN